jgi:predicted phosphodiesterase
MTYGLISDIHGNLEAFEAALAELREVDGFLCLGDIVGYGPDPTACIERLRQLPRLTCIAGNHDLAAVGRYDLTWFNDYAREALLWTQEQLSSEQASYLGALPLTAEVGKAILVHGSLPKHMDYVTNAWEAMLCFNAMPGALCFLGHTHVAEYYRQRNGSRFAEQIALRSGGDLALEPELRYIVNPGAVGQPRDGNPAASCGIYDPETGALEIRRVAYDVASVQEKVRRAGLPGYLADRLQEGR